MSIPQELINHIAGLGRGGDSLLLHVRPDEIETLRAAGKLTYNPHTGLPEAQDAPFGSDITSMGDVQAQPAVANVDVTGQSNPTTSGLAGAGEAAAATGAGAIAGGGVDIGLGGASAPVPSATSGGMVAPGAGGIVQDNLGVAGDLDASPCGRPVA